MKTFVSILHAGSKTIAVKHYIFFWAFFFVTLYLLQGAVSSNPGQNCHFFSTLQHPWHPHFWDSNMPLYMHNFYGQAESGGSLLKIDLCTMLCSKKTFNFESFEFPSWEFKNIFWGVYPHQTRAPCTICIPPNRKGHIDPSFPQGVEFLKNTVKID